MGPSRTARRGHGWARAVRCLRRPMEQSAVAGEACEESIDSECSRRGAAQTQRRWHGRARRTRKRASEGRDKNRFPRSAGQLTLGPGSRR